MLTPVESFLLVIALAAMVLAVAALIYASSLKLHAEPVAVLGGRRQAPARSLPPSRTLVIITGQTRTLQQNVRTLHESFVQPNEPADVVVALDGFRGEVDETLLPPNWRVLYLGPMRAELHQRDPYIEFSLMLEAMDRIPDAASRYRYILETRTDLYWNMPPLCLGAVYADSLVDFQEQFSRFRAALADAGGGEHPIFAWLMCSGVPELLHSVFQEEYVMPFFQAPLEINSDLRRACEGLDADAPIWQVQRDVRELCSRFEIVFNIGPTWVRHAPVERALRWQEQLRHHYSEVPSEPESIFRTINTGATEYRIRFHALQAGLRPICPSSLIGNDLSFQRGDAPPHTRDDVSLQTFRAFLRVPHGVYFLLRGQGKGKPYLMHRTNVSPVTNSQSRG